MSDEWRVVCRGLCTALWDKISFETFHRYSMRMSHAYSSSGSAAHWLTIQVALRMAGSGNKNIEPAMFDNYGITEVVYIEKGKPLNF